MDGDTETKQISKIQHFFFFNVILIQYQPVRSILITKQIQCGTAVFQTLHVISLTGKN